MLHAVLDMASMRTQVYLRADQRRGLATLTRTRHASMAELIRRAIDRLLADEMPDLSPVLEAAFGAVPDFAAPDRDEWEPAAPADAGGARG